jgi:mannose-6-phosphate isomerase-like protein (cupin superfamily)
MTNAMPDFATHRLPTACDVLAPDGSEVRILLALDGGSAAHFRLAAGQVSFAVEHRTVSEIWYVVSGTGELWRKQVDREEITPLAPGVCITIPLGTEFQFRAAPTNPLDVFGVTLPPWPGPEEAAFVDGKWKASAINRRSG